MVVRTASTPTRSSTPRSEKPIRMNTNASRPNTSVRQKAVPCIRTLAGRTTCWYQPKTMPAATVAITPETCSASPAR